MQWIAVKLSICYQRNISQMVDMKSFLITYFYVNNSRVSCSIDFYSMKRPYKILYGVYESRVIERNDQLIFI